MTIGEVDLFVGFFISNGKIGMTFQYRSQVKVSVDFSPDLARLSGLRSDETYVTGEDDERFVVDRILKARKRDGKIQYLVSWKGYLSKFDSWVDELATI